jgi:hypothetical protein
MVVQMALCRLITGPELEGLNADHLKKMAAIYVIKFIQSGFQVIGYSNAQF